MKKSIIIGAFFFSVMSVLAQTNDEKILRNIYNSSLTNGKSYTWLEHLSNKIGARLSGSENAEKAV